MPSLFGYVGSFLSNNKAAAILGFTAMAHQMTKNYWVPESDTTMINAEQDGWFKSIYLILDALAEGATFAGIGYASDKLSTLHGSAILSDVRSFWEQHKMALIFGAGRVLQAAWQDYWVYKNDTDMTNKSGDKVFKGFYCIMDYVATAVQWGGVGHLSDQVMQKLYRPSIIEELETGTYNSINPAL